MDSQDRQPIQLGSERSLCQKTRWRVIEEEPGTELWNAHTCAFPHPHSREKSQRTQLTQSQAATLKMSRGYTHVCRLCKHMCGGQRSTPGVNSHPFIFSLFLYKKVNGRVSHSPGTHQTIWPASPRDPFVSAPPTAGRPSACRHPWLFISNMSLGKPVQMLMVAHSLLTELSPQPLYD